MTGRMDSPGRIPSSPPKGGSLEEELAYYKSQYNQVELELQEFQNSSKELEAELEKDIEESETRERRLREKAEALNFEVDEWKTKYQQSKLESNNAQNVLQKEITTLRDSNRTLQYKLRDIEVANDDFERQARHQHSSLEDLESKYNVAIERGVMLEEEIKIGEQEREDLRVQTQRLKDELSEIKVELEIVQGKLRHAETTIERDRRNSIPIATESLRAPSPLSEGSSATTTSSPSALTPPPSQSEPSLQTSPPSPPLSEASGTARSKVAPKTPLPRKATFSQSTTTPRPSNLSGIRPPRHSRGPSIPGPSILPRTPVPSSKTARPANGSRLGQLTQERPNARSGSLHQVRGLISKMQKLEERVHTARSKLPAPTTTPPRASPRSSLTTNLIPSSVTVRSARKRTSASTTSSLTQQSTDQPRSASRLSFGFSGKIPEPPSRPSSRASHASVSGEFARPERPSSRASITGRVTPSGNRPRSSIGGNFAAVHGSTRPEPPRSSTPGPRLGHSLSRSVSAVSQSARDDKGEDMRTPMTARRTTVDRNMVTGIPVPGSIGRRQSGSIGIVGGARRQSGAGPAPDAVTGSGGDMRPPSSKGRKVSGVGETY